MKIIEAEGESDYAAARDLIAAYQRWLGVDLEFQGFSKELDAGLCHVVGGGRRGFGRVCRAEATWERRCRDEEDVTIARRLGYRAIRLDTVPRLDRAMRIYEGAGFTRIPPYRHNPDPDAVFMELRLG